MMGWSVVRVVSMQELDQSDVAVLRLRREPAEPPVADGLMHTETDALLKHVSFSRIRAKRVDATSFALAIASFRNEKAFLEVAAEYKVALRAAGVRVPCVYGIADELDETSSSDEMVAGGSLTYLMELLPSEQVWSLLRNPEV
jgi:hypothetical protein